MQKKNPVGRPQKYKSHYPELAYEHCQSGVTDKELALLLHVSRSTINRWKHRYKEFWDAIRRGKHTSDLKVVRALMQCTQGVKVTTIVQVCNTHDQVLKTTSKIKYLAPQLKAIALWLTQRAPENWSDEK